MEEKEKMNPFFKLLIILFLIFIAFYIALESGYYPSRVQKKAMITKNNIDNFEKVIESGSVVNPDGYNGREINYSNFVTKTGNALTYTLGKTFVEGTKEVKKIVKVLFW